MKTSGIILELNKNQAIIMTNEAGFMVIKRKSGMFIGEQVDICQPGLKRFGFTKYYYSLGLAGAAIFMFSLLLTINYFNQTRLYSYVSVDINPSMEFAINKEIRIISIKDLNNDAMILIRGTHFKNMPLDKALLLLVNKAEQNKYLHNKKGNYVLISAAATPVSVKKPELLTESINKVREKLKKRNIQLQFIQATLTQRKIALQNHLSMGRYLLSVTANHNGQLVNLEEAKTDRISILLEKAGLVREAKAGTGINHKIFDNSSTALKVKNIVNNSNDNNSNNSHSKSNDDKDNLIPENNGSGNNEENKEKDLDSTISGNDNKKINSSSNGSISHEGGPSSENNSHNNLGKK